MTDADRARTYRNRRRRGRAVLAVEFDAIAFAEAAIDAGLVPVEASEDRALLSEIAAKVLRGWQNSVTRDEPSRR